MGVKTDHLRDGEHPGPSCIVAYGRERGKLEATSQRLLLRLGKKEPSGFTYDELEDIVPVKERYAYRLDVYSGTKRFALTTEDTNAPAVVDATRRHVAEALAASGVEARFAGMTVAGGVLSTPTGTVQCASVMASVDAGGQIRGQKSVAAVLAFGILGLAATKKVDERTLYLSLVGPGLSLVLELPPDRVEGARRFAALIASHAPGPTPGASDIPAQIKSLADLRDAGVLTDEEFSAKKADLLARM